MPNARLVFQTLLGVNIIVLMLMGVNYTRFKAQPPLDSLHEISRQNAKYKFDYPFLAFHLLEKLDSLSILDLNTTTPEYFEKTYRGLTVNPNYCSEHRAHFVTHPEIVFDEINLVSDFSTTKQIKSQTLLEIGGQDVQPEISLDIITQPENRKFAKNFTYPLSIDANIIFLNVGLYRYRLVGKHFSCLSQVSNHIPGSVYMLRKDFIGDTIAEYTKQYESRPQCFDNNKFFPKTFVLWKKDHCEEFFDYFASEEYKELKKERGIVYLRKVSTGVHKGQGVFPLTEEAEQELMKEYLGGFLCGKNENTTVIQQLIHNPLLIEGRKFDFRVYMLIASTNPMIAYFHDGYLRISLSEYDSKSKEKTTFVTNIVLNHDVFEIAEKNGTYNGMTKEEMEAKTCWWFDDLQRYLVKIGRVVDPNWLDNHLRAQMKKIMIHLTRMAEKYYAKQSSLSELYGIDLMLDGNLDVWFIELNTMPLIEGWNDVTREFFNKMMKDYFEIEVGLLRSRMLRVVKYINSLKRGFNVDEDGGIKIDDFENVKKGFEEVSKNYFEEEFEVGVNNNGFKLIVDHNMVDGDLRRYNGILSKDCF